MQSEPHTVEEMTDLKKAFKLADSMMLVAAGKCKTLKALDTFYQGNLILCLTSCLTSIS